MVLRSPGLGVARARNLGASHASGDVILFADAHVRAPEGWHIPVTDALRDERVGAVAPGIYSLTDPERRGFGMSVAGPDLRVPWLRKAGSAPYPVPVLPGGFLAMRRETYLRTGGYDPGMRQLGGNDAELSCRLWLSGYEQKVVPELEVGHLFRSAAPYPAKWVALLHNRLRMALVHFHAGTRGTRGARLARLRGFPGRGCHDAGYRRPGAPRADGANPEFQRRLVFRTILTCMLKEHHPE